MDKILVVEDDKTVYSGIKKPKNEFLNSTAQ